MRLANNRAALHYHGRNKGKSWSVNIARFADRVRRNPTTHVGDECWAKVLARDTAQARTGSSHTSRGLFALVPRPKANLCDCANKN